MDSPEQYIERLHEFQQKLEARLPKFTAQQAMNATAQIVHRIQEQGTNADGAVLGVYTSEPYKNKRSKRGRQTEYVDLTFTRGGAGMFGSTGIVSETNANGVVNVVVAGRDSFTQDKLEWNSERYGDVLELSKREEEILFQGFEDLLTELIIETGL